MLMVTVGSIRPIPETTEHVLIHCLKYCQERRLFAKIEASEIIFEYSNILQRNAGKSFHFLFLFFKKYRKKKNTFLLKRI